jgi:hypothetical protein
MISMILLAPEKPRDGRGLVTAGRTVNLDRVGRGVHRGARRKIFGEQGPGETLRRPLVLGAAGAPAQELRRGQVGADPREQ